MNIYILLLLIALGCGLSLGWFGRKLIGRIEQLEAVTKRRRLPNPTLAALEDIAALADMMRGMSGDTDKMLLMGMTLLLEKDVSTRLNLDAFSRAIQEISKQIREDPHGYDADKPMSER